MKKIPLLLAVATLMFVGISLAKDSGQQNFSASNDVSYFPASIVVTATQGSLKANIERIAAQHGWNRVVWIPENDYQWVGTTQLSGANLPGVLETMLQRYPLQAVFYQGNHVLVIVPRDLQWSNVS